MNLNDEQKKTIAQRLNDGDSIADIQRLISNDFGIALTFMETRFLLDDLNLELKKEDPVPEVEEPKKSAATPVVDPSGKGTGTVAVEIDKIVQPGASVSGTVSFSDGVTAKWYVDPMGRLGLDADQEGYQPSAEDIETFQNELQSKMQAPGL